MLSEKQIQASRANGARSRGPKTPRGKSVSSLNALRHGLLSKLVVLHDEPTEAFQSLFAAYLDRFGPLDAVEIGMIEEMVSTFWRTRRAWAIENRLLDTVSPSIPAASPLDRVVAAFTDSESAPKLALLHRYETRLRMMFQRAFQNLLVLRRSLPPNEAPIPNEPGKSLISNNTTVG
jgi:hypothetical protein